jgi:hypothetical protein
MTWDYFISHASEDKDLVARPLAHVLSASGFKVWYDEFSLRVGDSLFQSISRGLAESRFGIVILSPSFMQKSWTQNELGGIWARETGNQKLLLPVWHRIDAAQIAKRAPMLADRVAVSTEKGLQYVSEQIVLASFPKRSARLPLSLSKEINGITESRKILQRLLESGAQVNDLRLFLSAHPELLFRRGVLFPAYKVGAEAFADFFFIYQHGITGPMQMEIVLLGPGKIDSGNLAEIGESLATSITTQLGKRKKQEVHGFNDYLGSPYVGEYAPHLKIANEIVEVLTAEKSLSPDTSLDKLRTLKGWNIHMLRPDLWSARLLILLGRRDEDGLSWKAKIPETFGNFVEIASYDRLLDSPREQ